MNKYVIPICDVESGIVWMMTFSAKSVTDCKEKLMNELIESYDLDTDITDYPKFIKWLDTSQNILVGNIKDIEEL